MWKGEKEGWRKHEVVMHFPILVLFFPSLLFNSEQDIPTMLRYLADFLPQRKQEALIIYMYMHTYMYT